MDYYRIGPDEVYIRKQHAALSAIFSQHVSEKARLVKSNHLFDGDFYKAVYTKDAQNNVIQL